MKQYFGFQGDFNDIVVIILKDVQNNEVQEHFFEISFHPDKYSEFYFSFILLHPVCLTKDTRG